MHYKLFCYYFNLQPHPHYAMLRILRGSGVQGLTARKLMAKLGHKTTYYNQLRLLILTGYVRRNGNRLTATHTM